MKKIYIIILAFLLLSCTNQQTQTMKNNQRKISTVVKGEEPLRATDVSLIEDSLIHHLETKMKSVEDKDLDLYLSLINPKDFYYVNEQKRWFTEMTKDGMEQLALELSSIEVEAEDEVIAVIHQTHYYHGDVVIDYPLRFIRQNNQWYDAGYPFKTLQTESYLLKYMPDEKRVRSFQSVLDEVYGNLEQIFEERPDSSFEIKLYTDRELMRQRTIPSIGWLFTGWGEANEALKIWTGHEIFEGYKGTLQHELIHHITMGICNNNLPGWLADGIALHYGNYKLAGGNALSLGYTTKEHIQLTIEELENAQMWEAGDQRDTEDWYNTSEMYVQYIIDVYGHDMLMGLFYEAGLKEYNENVMNPDFKAQNNQTLAEVLKTVLNTDKAILSADYLLWLEDQ